MASQSNTVLPNTPLVQWTQLTKNTWKVKVHWKPSRRWWKPSYPQDFLIRSTWRRVQEDLKIWLNKLSVSDFWAISGNVKPPEWAHKISCPPAELRNPRTASQTTETGALSLVTTGTGCFDPCGSLVRVVSDQRGSSILRQGCHSVMLLGNDILTLPIMWQA